MFSADYGFTSTASPSDILVLLVITQQSLNTETYLLSTACGNTVHTKGTFLVE